MKRNETLLDTLLELQTLDRVPRSGWSLRGVPEPESVAEHGWHVAFLVWALAPEAPGIDSARALELALLHDVAEVRIGDLPATAGRYFAPGAKHDAEEAAAADLLAPLGERARTLYREYVDKATPEARFVGACDKLQLMIKVARYESWGAAGLAEFWENPANFPDEEFPVVRRTFEALRARRTATASR